MLVLVQYVRLMRFISLRIMLLAALRSSGNTRPLTALGLADVEARDVRRVVPRCCDFVHGLTHCCLRLHCLGDVDDFDLAGLTLRAVLLDLQSHGRVEPQPLAHVLEADALLVIVADLRDR